VVVERYLAAHGKGGQTGANPYAPPRADLTPPPLASDGHAFYPPRSVSARCGWTWITDAWELFKGHPGAWIGALLLFYLIIIVLSLVPVVGGLVTTVLSPMLSAGLMLGAHAQYQGQGFRVSALFAGISRKPGPLAQVGLVYLMFALLIGLVTGGMFALMFANSGLLMSDQAVNPGDFDPASMTSALLLPTLFAILLGMPLAMAMFFAPALVALDEVPVMRSFKLSFQGCLRNILPFLVYGLLALVMILVGALPFFLGWLLVLPILTIAIYFAYHCRSSASCSSPILARASTSDR
jgi:uncharacterized membrane protein